MRCPHAISAEALPADVQRYNIIWTLPDTECNGSIPIGGGNVNHADKEPNINAFQLFLPNEDHLK